MIDLTDIHSRDAVRARKLHGELTSFYNRLTADMVAASAEAGPPDRDVDEATRLQAATDEALASMLQVPGWLGELAEMPSPEVEGFAVPPIFNPANQQYGIYATIPPNQMPDRHLWGHIWNQPSTNDAYSGYFNGVVKHEAGQAFTDVWAPYKFDYRSNDAAVALHNFFGLSGHPNIVQSDDWTACQVLLIF